MAPMTPMGRGLKSEIRNRIIPPSAFRIPKSPFRIPTSHLPPSAFVFLPYAPCALLSYSHFRIPTSDF